MLARIYFIAGSLLLGGYGVSAWEGWEYTDARRLLVVPAIGTVFHSASGGRGHTYSQSSYSGSRSGWIIFGGK